MASNDIICIMNQLKEAGKEKLISDNNDLSSGRSSRGKVSKTDQAAEDCYMKEVLPYLLECFKVLLTNITEREDNIIKELKEDFEKN